jgi:hypothetical protein
MEEVVLRGVTVFCLEPADPFLRPGAPAALWLCPAHAGAMAEFGWRPATEADLTVHGVMSS